MDPEDTLLRHKMTFVDDHIAAVRLRSVVNAEYPDRPLRDPVKQSVIKHFSGAVSPLLCRLEYKQDIASEIITCSAQIVHCTKHCRHMRIMTAQVKHSVLGWYCIDIGPECNSLICSCIQIADQPCIHTCIYGLKVISAADLLKIFCCVFFFKCPLRNRMEVFPVAFSLFYCLLHKGGVKYRCIVHFLLYLLL